MSGSVFYCKQFAVLQDGATMKVHTDGCLLGAWTAAHIPDVPGRILDIGTGTGIIALMLAQRYGNVVEGVEVDAESVAVAAHNFGASPWAHRMQAIHSAFELYRPEANYGLLVCNPPYFQNSLQSPYANKNTARHQSAFMAKHLFEAADRWLLPKEAYFTLIIPAGQGEEMLQLGHVNGLFLHHRVEVNSGGKQAKERQILAFGREPVGHGAVKETHLTIKGEVKGYSVAFSVLLKPYYTIF